MRVYNTVQEIICELEYARLERRLRARKPSLLQRLTKFVW